MARDRQYQQRYRGKPSKKQGSFPFFGLLLGIGLGGILLNQP